MTPAALAAHNPNNSAAVAQVRAMLAACTTKENDS